MANEDEACQRLQGIEGVGQITALAIVSLVGNNPHEFKNGRHFAAYLGLVPKQRSSGGKHVLLGISKRGDNTVPSIVNTTFKLSCFLLFIFIKPPFYIDQIDSDYISP